jgi:trigger factor
VGMIKKRFGTSVLVDVINQLLSTGLNNYLKDSDLRMFGEPIPSTQQTPVDFESQKDFEFLFDIGLLPEVNIELPAEQAFDYFKIMPTEEQINQFVAEKQKELGTWKEVDQIEKGDKLGMDIYETDSEGKAVKDGKSKYVTLNTTQITDDETLEKLLGLKADDEVMVDPARLFGSLEAALGETEFEEETITANPDGCLVKMILIERMAPAEANLDFYLEIFPDKGFTEIEQVRTEIAEMMQRYYSGEADRYLVMQAREYLMDNEHITLPDEFIKRFLVFNSEGKLNAEAVEAEYEMFRKQFINDIIDQKLVEKYPELEVTGDELMQEMENRLLSYLNQSPGGENDQMAQFAKTYAENWLKDEKNKEEVMRQRKELFEAKLSTVLKSNLTLVEKEINTDEFNTLLREKYGAPEAQNEDQDAGDAQETENPDETAENDSGEKDEQ